MRIQDGMIGGSLASDSMMMGQNKAHVNLIIDRNDQQSDSQYSKGDLNSLNKSPSAVVGGGAGQLFLDDFDNESQSSDNIIRNKKRGDQIGKVINTNNPRFSVDSQDLSHGIIGPYTTGYAANQNNNNLNDSNFNNLVEGL